MAYAAKHEPRRDLQFHLTWLAIWVGFEAIAFTIAATGELLGLVLFFSTAAGGTIVAWAWTSGWPEWLRVPRPPARYARR